MDSLEQKIVILNEKLSNTTIEIVPTIKKIYEMHMSSGKFNIDNFSDDIATFYIINKNAENKFNSDCDVFTDNIIKKIKRFIPEDNCSEPIESLTDFIRSFFAIDIEFTDKKSDYTEGVGYIVDINIGDIRIVRGAGNTYDEAKIDAAREALKRIKYDKTLLADLFDYEDESLDNN